MKQITNIFRFGIISIKKIFLLSFLIVCANYILCLSIFTSRLSYDDWQISQYASGTLISDIPAEFLIYTHIFIGLIINFLYKNLSYFPWYGIYLHLSLFLSSWFILFAILRNKFSVERILLFLLFFYLAIAKMFLEIQYSVVAGFCTTSGLILFISTFDKPSKKTLMLSSIMLFLGFLIRKESGFLLVCATFFPALLYYAHQYRYQLDKKHCLIYCIFCAVLTLFSHLFELSYYEKHHQLSRLEMNKKLNYFYNAEMLHYNQYPEAYKQVGLTKTDYFFGIHLYNFADKQVITQEKIDTLLSYNDIFTWQYIKRRGIKECILSLFYFAKDTFIQYISLLLACLFLQKVSQRKLASYILTFLNINLGLVVLFFTLHISYSAEMIMYPILFLLILYHSDREIVEKKYQLITFFAISILLVVSFKQLLNKNAVFKEYVKQHHTFLSQLSENKLYILWDGNENIRGIGALDDIKKYQNKHLILANYYIDAPTVEDKLNKFHLKNIYQDLIDRTDILLATGEGAKPHYKDYMKQHYNYDLQFIEKQKIEDVVFFEVKK